MTEPRDSRVGASWRRCSRPPCARSDRRRRDGRAVAAAGRPRAAQPVGRPGALPSTSQRSRPGSRRRRRPRLPPGVSGRSPAPRTSPSPSCGPYPARCRLPITCVEVGARPRRGEACRCRSSCASSGRAGASVRSSPSKTPAAVLELGGRRRAHVGPRHVARPRAERCGARPRPRLPGPAHRARRPGCSRRSGSLGGRAVSSTELRRQRQRGGTARPVHVAALVVGWAACLRPPRPRRAVESSAVLRLLIGRTS